MSETFQLFRLSLLLRRERSLFGGPDPTREEYLRSAFGREYAFSHYKTPFHYLPDARWSVPDAILARVGRAAMMDENRPPEEGFEEIRRPAWKACVLALDPRDHEDGQKLALQIDDQIGKPAAVLASLVAAINEAHPGAPFTIEVEPIIDAATFWDFAAKNQGAITSLTFEFVVPNGLWSAAGRLKSELRAAKEKTGAQKIINTFRSDEGLITDDEGVREAVDYAVSGSGAIRAKSMTGERFSSTRRPKTASLPEEKETEEPLIVRVARHIASVFDR